MGLPPCQVHVVLQAAAQSVAQGWGRLIACAYCHLAPDCNEPDFVCCPAFHCLLQGISGNNRHALLEDIFNCPR